MVDEYSRAVTEFNTLLDSLRIGAREPEDWNAAETARALAQKAWERLDAHLAQHRCLDLHWPRSGAARHLDVLEDAAMAALDVILVADDNRRFVDLNHAAAEAIGLPRDQVVGRRIDDFFSEIQGESVPDAWERFVADGVQCGICELIADGGRRKFEYRAVARFAPGLHLSVLREVAGG